jgi:peptidoglycan/LPS O-acetylase OafA/YrhL
MQPRGVEEMSMNKPTNFGAPPVHGELEGIQYVRGAAAVMVVIDHVSSMMSETKYFGRHPFAGVLEAGAVGVDLFFCLSGFIIVYIAMSHSLMPKLPPWDFFKRRFARIIPFMWVMIIAYAALRVSARGHFPYLAYLRGLTLFPVGHIEPAQVWTLRHEWLFYIVFAISFLSGRRWLFVLWALSPLAVMVILPPVGPDAGFGLELANFVFNNVDLLFGLGVIAGIFYVTRKGTWPQKSWAAPGLAAGIAVVFFAALILSYNRADLPQVLIIGVLSSICLVIACTVLPSKGPLAWLGKTLGDASYCIYLSHPMFISALLGLFAGHFHRAPDAVVMGTTVVISIIAGVIVNKLVEDPVVAWSKAVFLQRPRPRRGVAAPPIA